MISPAWKEWEHNNKLALECKRLEIEITKVDGNWLGQVKATSTNLNFGTFKKKDTSVGNEKKRKWLNREETFVDVISTLFLAPASSFSWSHSQWLPLRVSFAVPSKPLVESQWARGRNAQSWRMESMGKHRGLWRTIRYVTDAIIQYLVSPSLHTWWVFQSIHTLTCRNGA